MTEPFFTSLIHVIAHPEWYNGRTISVIGFGSMAFEGQAVYVTEADYRHGVSKNGIWLDTKLSTDTRKLHENYIIVVGVFDNINQGHGGMYSGALSQVTRLQQWRSRQDSPGL